MEPGSQFSSIDHMFPGGADVAITPWPSAPASKKNKTGYDVAKVQSGFADAPIEELDPTKLFASQRSIVRHHVEHYMKSEEPATDNPNEINKVPVVFRRKDGRDIQVTGHHLAAAAALMGRPHRAKIVLE